MEVAVVSAVVSTTLKAVGNKLAPLLIKEYSSIVGVKKDLQELQCQVSAISGWLETTGGIGVRDDPSLNWLKQLKDVAYAVEDVVYEFQMKAEKHDACGAGGILSKPKSFIFQCKAASKITEIKKRFATVVKQRTDFSAIANSLPAGRPVRDISTTSWEISSLPVVDEASVLGREQEKHLIISRLVQTNDQQKIKIVSIIGLGGSGKSTLARLIFNETDIIAKYFEVRLWVHVSKEFHADMLIKKLFEAFADNNPGQHSLPYMSETILNKLTGKRILLVLDDVWNECPNQWNDIVMVHLKSCAPGSWILLTTRDSKVAKIVGSAYPFDLPLLSAASSWQLFMQSYGTTANGLDSEFVKVGKEIVDKCGGIPLAIKVLAGVLRDKKQIHEWQATRDNNLLYAEGGKYRISDCLMLSYLNLPSHLKRCFTICSLFPKGYFIHKEQLIDLWMAHDMIALADGIAYLEHGSDNLNSLAQMFFLQKVDGKFLEAPGWGMHDLVHDLAESFLGDEMSLVMPRDIKNSTESYRYFSLVEESTNGPPKNIYKKTRAMYVANGHHHSIFDKGLKKAKHLRSIIVEHAYSCMPITILEIKNLRYLYIVRLPWEVLPEAISNIWSLQALHLPYANLHELPKSIGKLQKLRTLNLSHCKQLKSLPDSIGDCHMISTINLSYCQQIERLPHGITTLQHLEYLDLQNCIDLVELPDGIGNLKKLDVLTLKGCYRLESMPKGIGQLNRVQKLDFFVVGEGEKSAKISELGNVSWNSTELTIRSIEHVIDPNDAHIICLKQRTNLQRLELFWGINEGTDVGKDVAVLDGLEPPLGIKVLKVSRYAGDRYARWMLKQVGGIVQGVPEFTSLTTMYLSDFPSLEHLDGLVQLPCLEVLELSGMPSLESISGGPFPSLVKLTMGSLPRLGEVWMVMTEGSWEDGRGCSYRRPPHLSGEVQIGSRLEYLSIIRCPKLEVKPYLPSSLEVLVLRESNEQLLQSPGQDGQGSSSSTSDAGFPPSFSYSNLKKLEVCGMTGSSSTGSGSRREWQLLQHFITLEDLSVKYCVITELPESMRSLTSLRCLGISRCCDLLVLPDWLGELRSLEILTIKGSNNSLISLPPSMQQLTSLQELNIWDLPALTSLPQSISRLTSLKYLEIGHCLGIKSLPEWIEGLTALQTLLILFCPDLERRCDREKGEDWHLISHIHDVRIRGSRVRQRRFFGQ